MTDTPIKATDFIRGPAREEGEIYCDYMARKHWERLVMKQYLYGQTIWIGVEKGPMYNLDRKTRRNKSRNKKDARKARLEEIRSAQGFTRKKTRKKRLTA